MSKKESSSESSDQVPDLSALDFGPAWARKDQKKQPRKPRQERGRDSGRKQSSRGRADSRQGKDAHSSRNQKAGRGRHAGQRSRERKPAVAPPEGVTARIMPIEEGMDAMAKQISATGRTHSVFDLAWLVLGALDRFYVIFESEEPLFYRSRSDHSVWISKRECLSHFWSSDRVKKYYDEEITEVEPPKGNFQSVARCGFSGKLIGPPNHHAYQQTLLNLHREKFSHIPLDRYKSKIVMEHSEEAVQEWLDMMKKHIRWRPKPKVAEEVPSEKSPESTPEEPPVEKATSEAPTEDAIQESTPETEAPETPTSETASPETETPETDQPPASAPIIEPTVVILDNRREVEQHFLSHGFAEEYENHKMVSALANIPPRMISPGLMTLLKNTVAEEKRYPGSLSSILCRQMSGRHLAVFKWKKRLHCGPARPKRVPDDMVMADRPSELFHWVVSHPGGSLDEMWKDCLPEGIDEETRLLWYHDLHWLINEGLVLLFSDGTLHAAKELEKPDAKQTLPKAKKKKSAAEEPTAQASDEEPPAESPPEEN